MGNMNLMFGLITTGCGVYCLYLWLKIKLSGQVPDGAMILPRGYTMGDCLEPEEFMAHAMPRLMIFAVLILFFGVLTIADAYFDLINQWTAHLSGGMRLLVLEIVTCIVPLAVVIWFGVSLRRVQKRLF